MSNRLKLYTRSGDKGYTSLHDGMRVKKDCLRVSCYGLVDELNSHLGLLRESLKDLQNSSNCNFSDILSALKREQNVLFILGGELASSQEKKIQSLQLESQHVLRLEKDIDFFTSLTPELKNFILPGGCSANAMAHVVRCLSRKTERYVVSLHSESYVSDHVLRYLNRFSDWVFALSRLINVKACIEEEIWSKELALQN